MTNITDLISVVKRLIITEYGSKDVFGSKLTLLWNEHNTVWQILIEIRGQDIPITSILPSYPNPADTICYRAACNILEYGHPGLAHLMSSMISGFQIDGETIYNPQAIDWAITRQLGCVIIGGQYKEFLVMPQEERYGYAENNLILEQDYLS